MTARPLARIALPLLAVAALGATAGCSGLSEATTLRPYSAADGVNARSGDLSALNLGVVATAEGEPGLVTGALVNRGTEPDRVSVVVEGLAAPVEIEVPARGSVVLGSGEDQQAVVVPALTKAPGTTLRMLLSSSRAGELRATVPVLAATGPFATVTPSATASQPTATQPTATETAGAAEPTATATTTATATATASQPTATAAQ